MTANIASGWRAGRLGHRNCSTSSDCQAETGTWTGTGTALEDQAQHQRLVDERSFAFGTRRSCHDAIFVVRWAELYWTLEGAMDGGGGQLAETLTASSPLRGTSTNRATSVMIKWKFSNPANHNNVFASVSCVLVSHAMP